MTGETLHMANVLTNLMADLSQKIIMGNFYQAEDVSDLEDHLESLTEAQLQSSLECQENHLTKTKSTALDAKNLPTCKNTVQN